MNRHTVLSTPDAVWPFPCAFGWYSAGYSTEFAPARVERRRYVETDLVVWRDEDGIAHVMDAYCPHLGAHLGVGGCVRGTNLVCPFHQWAFDTDGRNVDIPYADRTNAKARVRTYPTVERNGMVFFWYHPDPAVEPGWEIPEIEAAAHGYRIADEWVVAAAWQEIAENAVDGAHFQYVHGTSRPGELIEADFSGYVRTQKVAVKYNTAKGPLEGWQEGFSYGPGFGMVHFHIFGDAYLFSANTPIERRQTLVRFAWVFADDPISNRMGAKFSQEVVRQFEEDIPIWENKRYLADPALATNEKPIMDLRKWASQFYVMPEA